MRDDKKELFQLYTDYMEELWDFSGVEKQEYLDGWFKTIYNDPELDFFKIYVSKIDESEKLAGFLVIKNMPAQDNPAQIDKFICESYVCPEYRDLVLFPEFIKDKSINKSVPVMIIEGQQTIIYWPDLFEDNELSLNNENTFYNSIRFKKNAK